MRSRIFIGYKYPHCAIFRAAATPTPETHPQYAAVVGPFRTLAGARVMLNAHGPLIQTVADAERTARYA